MKESVISRLLAILSSDALSSVAYGPEQILITLAVVGAIYGTRYQLHVQY